MSASFSFYTIGIVRIITGVLLVYHGMEMLNPSTMNNYLTWEKVKALPAPSTMVYAGKIIELAGGIGFILGWRTRWAAAGIIFIMLFICFYLGGGKFWYEDQHPFVIALLSSLYLFGSPGAWAMDSRMIPNQQKPST